MEDVTGSMDRGEVAAGSSFLEIPALQVLSVSSREFLGMRLPVLSGCTPEGGERSVMLAGNVHFTILSQYSCISCRKTMKVLGSVEERGRAIQVPLCTACLSKEAWDPSIAGVICNACKSAMVECESGRFPTNDCHYLSQASSLSESYPSCMQDHLLVLSIFPKLKMVTWSVCEKAIFMSCSNNFEPMPGSTSIVAGNPYFKQDFKDMIILSNLIRKKLEMSCKDVTFNYRDDMPFEMYVKCLTHFGKEIVEQGGFSIFNEASFVRDVQRITSHQGGGLHPTSPAMEKNGLVGGGVSWMEDATRAIFAAIREHALGHRGLGTRVLHVLPIHHEFPVMDISWKEVQFSLLGSWRRKGFIEEEEDEEEEIPKGRLRGDGNLKVIGRVVGYHGGAILVQLMDGCLGVLDLYEVLGKWIIPEIAQATCDIKTSRF